MSKSEVLEKVKQYFKGRLDSFGPDHRSVDYNSVESQELRFQQLIKIVDTEEEYSILDFGSGYGALYDYLQRLGHRPRYLGCDALTEMVDEGRRLHPDDPHCRFASDTLDLTPVDYAVLSGTFNMKLDAEDACWETLVIDTLQQMNAHALKGFAFNMLTKYSDEDRKRSDLYYGDPCFFFDYCKRNFARNVALLHDYKLYDFTILVRKGLD